MVYPELLRIGRNQQQEQEQEQERRGQQLQHALEALDASNSEIKSLQNKVRERVLNSSSAGHHSACITDSLFGRDVKT